jgi:hypothetical protein
MVNGGHGAHGTSVQLNVGEDTEYGGGDVTTLLHRMEAKTARVATWTMSSATHMPVLMLSDCLRGRPGWQPMPQPRLLDAQRDGSDSPAGHRWPTLPSLN